MGRAGGRKEIVLAIGGVPRFKSALVMKSSSFAKLGAIACNVPTSIGTLPEAVVTHAHVNRRDLARLVATVPWPPVKNTNYFVLNSVASRCA